MSLNQRRQLEINFKFKEKKMDELKNNAKVSNPKDEKKLSLNRCKVNPLAEDELKCIMVNDN